jgi:hypothetical protein
MRARTKFINAKHKLIRFPEDPIYSSRPYHALFNRFTKSGRKDHSLKQLNQAYLSVKYSRCLLDRTHRTFEAKIDRFIEVVEEPLTMQFARKAKEKLPIAFPQRRNKKDIAGAQRFYETVKFVRKERNFRDRFCEELSLLVAGDEAAPTLKSRDQYFENDVYEGRHWPERRWK